MKVEFHPQPRVRVASVATVDPEADRPIDLGNTDGHVHAVAVEVTLEGASLEGSEERILDIDSDLVEAGSTLADVDLTGELMGRH